MEKLKTVKEVCQLTGLTGKHLYYFHHEKVVKATAYANYSVEGNDGYKLYDEAAVAKLQQIAMYFDLGLKRNEIRDIMLAPDYDIHCALDELKIMLEEKRNRIDRNIAAIEKLRLIGTKNGMLSVVRDLSLEEWGKNIRALPEATVNEYIQSVVQLPGFDAYDAMIVKQLEKFDRIAKHDLPTEPGQTVIRETFRESQRLLGFAGHIITAGIFLGSLGEGMLAKEEILPVTVSVDQGKAALQFLQADGEVFIQEMAQIIAQYHSVIGKPYDDPGVEKLVEKVKERFAEHFGICSNQEYRIVLNMMDLPTDEANAKYVKYVIEAIQYYL